jgi:hypothetical protein
MESVNGKRQCCGVIESVNSKRQWMPERYAIGHTHISTLNWKGVNPTSSPLEYTTGVGSTAPSL